MKSSTQIVDALVGGEDGTRGIGSPPDNDDRGVGVKGRPSVALDIPFELNSDRLQPEASTQLDALAQALATAELATSRLEIIGHTDSSGAAEYNLKLSEGRAESVRRYLIAKYQIGDDRLRPTGRGEEEPIPGTDPASAENRRVEIRLLSRD